MNRERLSSRLGFILLSAGCAIGLGNVWRFPYIVGKNGGAAFLIIYIACLIILGLPILICEYAVGRASQKTVALSFDVLEPKNSYWHLSKWAMMAGNYLLVMFYSTISGWVLYYFVLSISGHFENQSTEQISNIFNQLLSQPLIVFFYTLAIIIIGFLITSLGLQKGVERITKYMMITLISLMLILSIHSFFLPNAKEGLRFYLQPNLETIKSIGLSKVVFQALGQAFFTLSIGMGTMATFGSYIEKNRRLSGEAIHVVMLDTLVALIAGLIIFPACFAFGIKPTSGPNLLFVTLPNVFKAMHFGRLWSSLFFLFMSFAALSTIVAVFQNLIAYHRDLVPSISHSKSAVMNAIVVTIFSLPTIFAANLLSFIQPLGKGTTILDLEDFLVSNNILPLGSIIYLLFCTSKVGWGYQKFILEVNEGEGIVFPRRAYLYLKYIIPIIILIIFIEGYRSILMK